LSVQEAGGKPTKHSLSFPVEVESFSSGSHLHIRSISAESGLASPINSGNDGRKISQPSPLIRERSAALAKQASCIKPKAQRSVIGAPPKISLASSMPLLIGRNIATTNNPGGGSTNMQKAKREPQIIKVSSFVGNQSQEVLLTSTDTLDDFLDNASLRHNLQQPVVCFVYEPESADISQRAIVEDDESFSVFKQWALQRSRGVAIWLLAGVF